LGGKIRIRDREQGIGTTFEVQLPGQVLTCPGNDEETNRQAATSVSGST